MRSAACGLSLLVMLSITGIAHAGTSQPADPDAPIVEGKLGRWLNHFIGTKLPSFSGAVLVYKDGQVVLSSGYGLADRKGRIRCTRNTIFDIMSCSKNFTAAAILKLQMQGKLNIHDPISKYIGPVHEGMKTLTFHHLMTHTSGINVRGFNGSTRTYDDFLYRVVARAPLHAKPGQRYVYSNVGYAVLAMLVEKIANEPFESYVRRHLWQPAGMTQTGFAPDFELAYNTATHGYEGRATDLGSAIVRPLDWMARGPSSVLTTVGDLLKWYQALQGEKVLSEAAKATFFKAYKNGYACGWTVTRSSRGTRRFGHTGSGPGYASIYMCFPDEDAVVVVLSNRRVGLKPVFSPVARYTFGMMKLPPQAATLGPPAPPAPIIWEVPQQVVLRSRWTNGRLEARVPYVSGKRHGLYKRYYAAGKLWATVPYENGKVVGTIKEFFPNGKVVAEDSWRATGTGTFKKLYPSGKVCFEIPYTGYKRDGVEVQYKQNGELFRKIRHFADGTHKIVEDRSSKTRPTTQPATMSKPQGMNR